MSYELVTATRDCKAITIPYGTETLIFKDEKVYVTQNLGGSFTLQRDNGQLVRIEGKDADVIGKEVPPEAKVFKIEYGEGNERDLKDVEKDVWDQLKTCYDPEIPVNIVELGLIYSCDILPHPEGGKRVNVVMTLTAPGCGMSTVLKAEIEQKLSRIAGVRESQVEVTFEPPWNQSLMTEAARLQLGMM
ncbi:MAG TPA: putative Fe-S cluster assembly protein SufT [bacterium]|nr:putative Fe-S cluster assembly protein SufT [bacterium]